MELIHPIFKWLHIIAGITWIGLLYFFNFINGHVAATMDGDTKKKVFPELMPRTLYWFRWGAAWTYRLSRDPEDRRVAESVGAGLQTLQHEDGYWRAGVSVYDMQAGKTGEASLAATAEFVTLLSWMCLDLDG